MAKFATVDAYVAAVDPPLRELAERLVTLIDGVLPGAGAIWHGHPVWSLGPAPGRNTVCLLKVYPAYVTFGLFRGREIADPSGRLDTRAGLAHVKLRTNADVDAGLFTTWLTRARDLENAEAPAS